MDVTPDDSQVVPFEPVPASVWSSIWNDAVDSVAGIFEPKVKKPTKASLQPKLTAKGKISVLGMLTSQLMTFSDEPDGINQLIDSLPHELVRRFIAEMNKSTVQYELIRKSPNLKVAQALYAIGITYKAPRVLSDVLHHRVFRNTVLQYPGIEYNWAYPDWTAQQIYNNTAEVQAINEWLDWLVFVVEVNPFKLVPAVGNQPRHTFNDPYLDKIWRTPAFHAVTLPDQKSSPSDIFRPGFIWFVRHYGDFKAGDTAGPRKLSISIFEVYTHKYIKSSTKEFGPLLLSLMGLCPKHLTTDSYPPWNITKEFLRSTINSVIRRGGSYNAILRLPTAPGEYHARYGNTALMVGNTTFLNECASIFGVPPTFSLEVILLPYIRVDVMPFFINKVPSSKNRELIKMIKALPVEYRVTFINMFQTYLLARDESWIKTIDELLE
jgi:hypothetical protein